MMLECLPFKHLVNLTYLKMSLKFIPVVKDIPLATFYLTTGLDADPDFEYFMPKHPFEVLEAGEMPDIPIVLGATRHDGAYPLDDIYNDFIKPNGFHKNETYIKNELLPFLLRILGR
jgi:hypothetical protein